MLDKRTMLPFSRRRALFGLSAAALGLGVPSLLFSSTAEASLSRALTLPELARGSRRIVRGTPVEHYCQWITAGGSKRIVTITRVLVSEDLGAPAPESEMQVLTWGGRVGDVAQLVHGEAALRSDEEGVLFLSGEHEGVRRMSAMAQGHYPLELFERTPRLRKSRQLDALLRREGAAVDALHHKSFSEAKALIRGALK